MNARKNPSKAEIVDIINRSRSKSARRIEDPRNGDLWYWPFEENTHAEGAEHLGVPYNRPPGGGDVVVI